MIKGASPIPPQKGRANQQDEFLAAKVQCSIFNVQSSIAKLLLRAAVLTLVGALLLGSLR